MKTTILSRILAVGIIMLTTLPVMAQGRIDKLVNQLEKKAEVTVTYTENRSPKTKKIVKQSTILSGNNSKDADALWQAFESERENSIKIVKSRNESFIIKFEDKNYSSSYVLSVHGGNWSLVISKKSPGFEDDDSLSFNFDFDGYDFSDLDLERLKSIESLNGLEGLSGLNDLGGRLNGLEFSGNVKVYDKDGRLIYQTPGMDKQNNSSEPRSKKSRSKSKSKSTSTSGSCSGSSPRISTTTKVITEDDDNVYTYTYVM